MPTCPKVHRPQLLSPYIETAEARASTARAGQWEKPLRWGAVYHREEWPQLNSWQNSVPWGDSLSSPFPHLSAGVGGGRNRSAYPPGSVSLTCNAATWGCGHVHVLSMRWLHPLHVAVKQWVKARGFGLFSYSVNAQTWLKYGCRNQVRHMLGKISCLVPWQTRHMMVKLYKHGKK